MCIRDRTYHGILDPQFDQVTQGICAPAVSDMIPGSCPIVGLPTWSVDIPDPETIDDGMNVLDGFVLVIDDWDNGEQFSFNWELLNELGEKIGHVAAMPNNPNNPTAGAIQGDEFGFGTFNMTLMGGAGGPFIAPPALAQFNLINMNKVNTGYSPPQSGSASADSPLVFAEDEDGNGVDQAPFNPIVFGEPGQGTYLFAEPGASVSLPKKQQPLPLFAPDGGNPIVVSGANLLPGPAPSAALSADMELTYAGGSNQSQKLSLEAGVSGANDFYLVLGSLTGFYPGQTLGDSLLPLNLDAYLNYTLLNPNQGHLVQSFGLLDTQGKATATVDLGNLPAGVSSQLANTALYHAFVVLDSSTGFVTSASNAVELRIVSLPPAFLGNALNLPFGQETVQPDPTLDVGGFRLLDTNGDGLDDEVRVGTKTSVGFPDATLIGTGQVDGDPFDVEILKLDPTLLIGFTNVVDLDGDGDIDLICIGIRNPDAAGENATVVGVANVLGDAAEHEIIKQDPTLDIGFTAEKDIDGDGDIDLICVGIRDPGGGAPAKFIELQNVDFDFSDQEVRMDDPNQPNGTSKAFCLDFDEDPDVIYYGSS